MIELAAFFLMISAAQVTESGESCRGVYMQNGTQPFVLINLKITGDQESLKRAKTAAKSIASHVSDENEDGKSVLYLSFFSDKDPAKVDVLWNQIEKGSFGKLEAKPFVMPMSMITSEHPCFGRLTVKK